MVEKGIGEKQGEEAQNGGLRKPLSREVEESRKAWWGGQQRMAQGYGGTWQRCGEYCEESEEGLYSPAVLPNFNI